MTAIVYGEGRAVLLHELQELFVRTWGGDGKPNYDRVLGRSFIWVTAHGEDPEFQRRGIATELVPGAIERCRGHGEWMHVDSDRKLAAGNAG